MTNEPLMFQGTITAIVTPFTPENRVDYAALEKLIDYQLQNGISAIVPCGTTGESPTLTEAEHQEVVRQTVRFVNKRVPVIAGTGSNCTETAMELSRAAERDGAKAVLSVVPYYNKPSQEGLYLHFKSVADAVGIPVVLYNIPGRSSANLEIDTIARLAAHKNIRAIKEATGNVDYSSQIRQSCDITILSGDDGLTLPLMAVGAKGVISVASNVAPHLMADLAAAALRHDYVTARALHAKLYPLFKQLFVEGNPSGVKAALSLQGRIHPAVRPPLVALTAANRDKLRTILAALKLL